MTKGILSLIIFPGLIFSTGCKKKIYTLPEAFDDRKPVEESFGVTYYYSDSARVRAKLSTPRLARYKKEKGEEVVFQKGLQIWFYSPATNQPDSKLSADYAVIYEPSRDMEARGNVVLRNNKDEVLETGEVRWKYKEQKIISKAFVKITTPTEIIYGNGFESNFDFSSYRIFKIRGRVRLSD